MSYLKKLSGAMALTILLAASALACGTLDPGQVQTPPCESGQPLTPPDDGVAQNEMSSSLSIASETESIVMRVATNLLESVLTIF